MNKPELTADVIVLGAGPGGMAAVAAAAGAGASVIAVEARAHIGGNAVWSTGYLSFVDSTMQREQGIADSKELFVSDARRVFEQAGERYGLVWQEPLVRLWASESAETHRILVERGVRFSRFIPRPGLHSVDRMAATVDTWDFQRAFQPDFELPAVTTLLRTTAHRLLHDGGKVSGVIVTDADAGVGERVLHARNGVILATGGYQANPALRRRYQPAYLAEGPYLGVETSRGDGHLLGQAIGGDLINMGYLAPLVIVSSSLVEDAIAVNAAGRRFHDECGPYDERVEALLAQPDRRAHYVVDATVAAEKQALLEQMPRPARRADTREELAAVIGCPPQALVDTIARWNAMLREDGADDEFGRVVMPPGRRAIETPPFSAVEMLVGVNFSGGGFRVTEQMQVLDIFGDPIGGLYAAGDCVGALGPLADLGGMHICGGLTFGRLAGHSAANAEHATERRAAVFGSYMPDRIGDRMPIVDLGGAR
ncbi:MAG TPA: FAD-binding protein [Solirubrobacteraceae bacterium]|nr:FAD-binding protein [Solirubrobacteraceae bacterium]